MIELVAMSPSGEVIFVRDRFDGLWEARRLTNETPRRVEARDIDRAVVDHGYLRVDEQVEHWNQLSKVVERHLEPAGDVGELPVNPILARHLIPVLHTWLRSPADRAKIPEVVNRLLRSNEVASDEDLRNELLDLQRDAQAPPANAPHSPAHRVGVVSGYFAPAA